MHSVELPDFTRFDCPSIVCLSLISWEILNGWGMHIHLFKFTILHLTIKLLHRNGDIVIIARFPGVWDPNCNIGHITVPSSCKMCSSMNCLELYDFFYYGRLKRRWQVNGVKPRATTAEQVFYHWPTHAYPNFAKCACLLKTLIFRCEAWGSFLFLASLFHEPLQKLMFRIW